jgi:lysophospholipase L1-like esterase
VASSNYGEQQYGEVGAINGRSEQIARQLAVAGAFGGVTLGVAGGLFAGVLLGQARLARHTIPRAEAPPPRSDGIYGVHHPGEPLRMVVLGDSLAAGLGVDRARDTPAALLAAGLAEREHRPVLVRNVAVSGALSAGLIPQTELAVVWQPDLAVIIVGGNDITHRQRMPLAVAHLADTVRELRALGCAVVVGTCPDLGTIRPIQPPLRWMVRRWSRDLAAAQTVAVVEAGGATVSLADIVGPSFYAQPSVMFSADRFHPSISGYAAAAAAILPTVIDVVRHPVAEASHQVLGDGVRSLAQAAVEAADQAGTEVTPARVGGRERGPAGRWVQLRHRVRQLTEWRQDPTAAPHDEPEIPAEAPHPGIPRPAGSVEVAAGRQPSKVE